MLLESGRVVVKMKKNILLLIGVIVLLSPTVSATDYYVSPSGGTNWNSCTSIGSPCSLGTASQNAQAGDTVYIMAGTYSGFSPSNSGSAGNYITFRNYQDDVVNINTNSGSAISVSGKDYLQFIGLNLNGGSQAGFYLQGPASNLILDRLTISGGYKGIQFVGSGSTVSDSTIRDCEISDTIDTCINLYQHNTNILIDNNHLSYCAWEQTGDENDGIQVNVWNGDGQGPDGIIITNNEIEYTGRQGLMTWNAINLLVKDNHFHHCGASGIQIEDGAVNVVVDGNLNEYNAQHYETETGVWIDNTENAVVQNNILRHNKIGLMISKSDQVIARNNIVYSNDVSAQDPAGIVAVKYDGVSNTNNMIVHNTVYRNGQGANHGGGISLGAWGTMESAVVKNNIASESGSEIDLYIKCRSYESDYNNYYSANSLSISVNGNTIGWDQYKSQTGQDQNSITQDPKFVDSSSGDFTLQSSSPCIDAGGPLATTVSSGSGTSLVVDNARYFTDGFGIIDGDMIQVGSNSPVRVVGVNYNSNTITLGGSISWNSGDAVNYAYSGNGPDIGAFEISGPSTCPNGICDSGETCSSCSSDCPTGSGEVCCSGTIYTGDCCSQSDCSVGEVCVSHSCQIPQPTCQSLNYLCCDACASGSHSGYDDDCPNQVCCDECDTECLISSTAWQNQQMQTQTGVFTFNFYATPNNADVDAVTALSAIAGNDFSDYAVLIRFATDGIIDAINGGDYTSDSTITYFPGTRYSFRVVIDVPSNTYSAYVTPQGGAEQTLATNYAFRDEQSGITEINYWGIIADFGNHQVCLTSTTCGDADRDSNGIVDINELTNYIGQWKIGNVSISELMIAIGEWKNGC